VDRCTSKSATFRTTTCPTSPKPTNLSIQPSGSVTYVSVAEYARWEGVSVQAIYARIRNGQLADGVVRHAGRYLIHPARAAAAWAQHGRPCNSRAAQLEQRLMLLPDQLADELAGEDSTYVRIALTRAILDLLD
jgi:hypothetical protein